MHLGSIHYDIKLAGKSEYFYFEGSILWVASRINEQSN